MLFLLLVLVTQDFQILDYGCYIQYDFKAGIYLEYVQCMSFIFFFEVMVPLLLTMYNGVQSKSKGWKGLEISGQMV